MVRSAVWLCGVALCCVCVEAQLGWSWRMELECALLDYATVQRGKVA